MLHGVEVAFGGAGAGASATALSGVGSGGLGGHGGMILGLMFCDVEGDVAGREGVRESVVEGLTPLHGSV